MAWKKKTESNVKEKVKPVSRLECAIIDQNKHQVEGKKGLQKETKNVQGIKKIKLSNHMLIPGTNKPAKSRLKGKETIKKGLHEN